MSNKFITFLQRTRDFIISHKKQIIYYSPIILAFALCISIICIIPLSVNFFKYLFLVAGNQLIAKQYLRLYFKSDMALLYFSIIGFVICVINCLLYKFTKFTQKTKLIWLHSIFFIIFFSLSISSQSKSQLSSIMLSLQFINPTSIQCTQRNFKFQCVLSKSFQLYQSRQLGFIIAFCLIFVPYAGLYHYNSLNQLEKMLDNHEKQRSDRGKVDKISKNKTKMMEIKQVNQKDGNSYVSQAKNITLISQMDQN